MRSTRLRAVGQRRRIRSLFTTTSSTRAATLRPGSSRSSSRQRCGRHSNRSASRVEVEDLPGARVWRAPTPDATFLDQRLTMTTIDQTDDDVSFHRPLWRTATMSLAAAGLAIASVFFLSSERAISAQDKYTVQVPNGLSFSEFRGFEDWPTIAVSQAGDLIEVIVGNPTMIEAFRSGIPGNGKSFPDGSKMAKIHWKTKKSAEAPEPTIVPDTLHDIDFMVKDKQRFPN